MKGTSLGEFEEVVLLIVGVLFDNAYGISIQEELLDRRATVRLPSAQFMLCFTGWNKKDTWNQDLMVLPMDAP